MILRVKLIGFIVATIRRPTITTIKHQRELIIVQLVIVQLSSMYPTDCGKANQTAVKFATTDEQRSQTIFMKGTEPLNSYNHL